MFKSTECRRRGQPLVKGPAAGHTTVTVATVWAAGACNAEEVLEPRSATAHVEIYQSLAVRRLFAFLYLHFFAGLSMAAHGRHLHCGYLRGGSLICQPPPFLLPFPSRGWLPGSGLWVAAASSEPRSGSFPLFLFSAGCHLKGVLGAAACSADRFSFFSFAIPFSARLATAATCGAPAWDTAASSPCRCPFFLGCSRLLRVGGGAARLRGLLSGGTGRPPARHRQWSRWLAAPRRFDAHGAAADQVAIRHCAPSAETGERWAARLAAWHI